MKIVKSNRGAITLFVLIAGLFFITFLTSMFMIGSVKRQAELEASRQTNEMYSAKSPEEAYQSYLGEDVVPIYTFEQLKKMCSNETIAINEEGGQYYKFANNAVYVLKNNIVGEYNGIMTIPLQQGNATPTPTATSNALSWKLEGNGKTIEINDTSKTGNVYYYYNASNNYAFPLTKEGYSYKGLMIHYDGINNTGNGHDFDATSWKDLSGNGNDGTLNGGATWNSNSLSFDGSNDWVSIGKRNYDNITMEATMVYNQHLTTSEMSIISNAQSGGYGISNYNGTAGYVEYNGFSAYIENKGYMTATSDSKIQNNKIYMYTGSYDGTSVKFWENGTKYEKNAQGTVRYGQNNTILALGTNPNGNNAGGSWLNGRIYSIRVYNRALTDEEVQNNYIVDRKRVNFVETTPTPIDLPDGWNPTTVADVITETSSIRDGDEPKERKVPIPVGYTVSDITGEDTIAGGLVIYEGTETVSTDTDAITTRNQYVWIPVDDINDMVMCDSHTESSDCNIVINGGKIYCSNHMQASDAELTNTATKFLCGKLYGGGNTFGELNPKNYSYGSGYREPAVITAKSGTASLTDYLNANTSMEESLDGYVDSTTGKGFHGYASAEEFLSEQKRQFNAMAKSVAIYGGFYVGRYEAGYDKTNNTYVSKKGVPANNIMQAYGYDAVNYPGGVDDWYGMYKLLKKSDTGITSQMIWGCQWDQVLKFVDNKRDNNGTGNLFIVRNVNNSRHADVAATGANSNDLVQNIYDLEGNFCEKVATALNSDARGIRGGFGGSTTASAFRSSINPIRWSSNHSTRPTLNVNL